MPSHTPGDDTRTPAPSRAERLRRGSAERREAQRARVHDLLLGVAEQQLLEKGYDTFSLREVAEAARYTPTTIYRHFRDRDALIEAVLQRWFERFARALEDADRSTTDPTGRLLAQADAYIRFALAEPSRYRVMFVQRPDIGVLPDGRSHLRDDRAFGVLIRATEALCAAGLAGSHDPMTVAMMLWLALHGVAAMAVSASILDARAGQGLGAAMSRVLLAGLRAS